jgi:glycosyltransferase involved in cell wall biosynthesis
MQNADIDGWLASFRPELVVISQGGTIDGLEWMNACRTRGICYVSVSHLSTDSLWPDARAAEEIAPLYESAACAFFVSENNRRVTEKHLGISLNRAKIVRNPFVVSFDNNVGWPANDGAFKLACVGRLGAEHKGQDLLFEVMREKKWRDRPLTISLVGEGHHRNTLERLAKMWDVTSIRFSGQVNDIESVWAAHQALIMPSRYEGLPLALVEAMLCRRMAILTDVGGHTELIDDDVNGFVAAAPTPHFIDDALERAWQWRNDWKKMGEAAGEKIRATIPRDPVGVFVAELERLLA